MASLVEFDDGTTLIVKEDVSIVLQHMRAGGVARLTLYHGTVSPINVDRVIRVASPGY